MAETQIVAVSGTGFAAFAEIRAAEIAGTITVNAGPETQVKEIAGTLSPAGTPNAGPDQTVAALDTVTLDGSGSLFASSYRWAQTAGPIVTLTGATTAHPTFTAPASVTGTSVKMALYVNGSTDVRDEVVVSVGSHAYWRLVGTVWTARTRVRIV